MSNYQHIKQGAYEANMQLPQLGLVLFTFGNVSSADRELGVFAIKPSGVPYAEMADVEFALIGRETRLEQFRSELRWNEVYYR